MNASQKLVQQNLNKEMLETGQIERHVDFCGHHGAIRGFADDGPLMAPDDEIVRKAQLPWIKCPVK
jgi:hypothetical protein